MSTGGAASARIGFDAVRALRNRTGLGNYARGVLQGLAEVAPNLTQLHYSPQSPRAELADFPASVRASLQLPTVAMQRPIIRQFWRTFRLGHRAARDGVALYHGLTQEIPRDLPGTGIPSLVTAADLLYHTHPELFPRIDRASYSWRYRWSMEHATAIVAISNWTKQQLHQHFGIPLSRIAVVPPARDPRFAMQRTTEELRMVRQRASLPERYIVAVGTLEPRKNQELAIAAMKLLDPSLPPLILIGRDGGSAAVLRSEIERQQLGDRVRLLTDVPFDELPAMIQGASLALYLSTAEGFGMPIVEAMSAGVPVVATTGGHLFDAGGDAARYVHPNDPPALAEAIVELVEPGAALPLIRLGLQHAATFEAPVLANQLLTVYDAVLSGNPHVGIETTSTPAIHQEAHQ